jgi:hypothetical protein
LNNTNIMYPKITHLPFKTINLLIGTEYLLGNDRNFLDVILKEDDKYGDYYYNDTEKFEELVLSLTDEQKKDLLAGMKMFNEEIIDLQFDTYYDQCKKDQQQAWSPKSNTRFVDFIAVEKDAIYEHKELRYLDLMLHNNLSQWFEKIVNIILGKVVVFRDFQSNLLNEKVQNAFQIFECLSYLANKYNSTIYLLTEDREVSYLISSFRQYYDFENSCLISFAPEYLQSCSNDCFDDEWNKNITFEQRKALTQIGTCQKFEWNENDTEIEVFNCLQ